MKKILFPTDFSPASASAFQYAMNIARALNADLDLMHVFHLPPQQAEGERPIRVQEQIAEMRHEVEDKMVKFEQEYTGHLNDTSFKKSLKHVIIYGVGVASEIIDLAKYNQYDLIIMGMQGEKNVLEKILGSISIQVLKDAETPVLAVPAKTPHKVPSQIAYATQLRPDDEKAVKQLGQFAKGLNAKVHFVHVHLVKDQEPAVIIEDEVKMLDLPVTDFTVLHGETAMEGLEEYNKEHDVDVLAVFRPERSWWNSLFHNSLIKRLAYHIEIPLLVFHK